MNKVIFTKMKGALQNLPPQTPNLTRLALLCLAFSLCVSSRPAQAGIEDILEIAQGPTRPQSLKAALEEVWKLNPNEKVLAVLDWDLTLVERGQETFRPGAAEALDFIEEKNCSTLIVTTRGWGMNPDSRIPEDAPISPRSRGERDSLSAAYFEKQAQAINEKLRTLKPSREKSLLKLTWPSLTHLEDAASESEASEAFESPRREGSTSQTALDLELFNAALGGAQQMALGLKKVQGVAHDQKVTGPHVQFAASLSQGVLFAGGYDRWKNSLKGKALEHVLDGNFGDLPFEKPTVLIIVDDNIRHLIQFGVSFQARAEKVYLIWYPHEDTLPKTRIAKREDKAMEEHFVMTWEHLKQAVRAQKNYRVRTKSQTDRQSSWFWSWLGY